jgi:hypothetical protein
VTGEVSSIFGKSEVAHDVAVEIALGDGAARLGLPAAPAGDVSAELSFGDRVTRAQWTAYCAAFGA